MTEQPLREFLAACIEKARVLIETRRPGHDIIVIVTEVEGRVPLVDLLHDGVSLYTGSDLECDAVEASGHVGLALYRYIIRSLEPTTYPQAVGYLTHVIASDTEF